MTCRTSVGAIRKVLPSSTTLEDDQINAAMEAARVMVDQVAAGCGSHLTDDILKEIEKYLAAHFMDWTLVSDFRAAASARNCCERYRKCVRSHSHRILHAPNGAMTAKIRHVN